MTTTTLNTLLSGLFIRTSFAVNRRPSTLRGNSIRRLQSEEQYGEDGEVITNRRRMQDDGEVERRRLGGVSSIWEGTDDLNVDDLTVERSIQGFWDTAYSKETCDSGIFAFELEVLEYTNKPSNRFDFQMGFIPEDCIPHVDNKWIGSRQCNGYAYIAESGQTQYYDGDYQYGGPYEKWATIGKKVKGVLDFNTGTIEYKVNGVSQGIAFTGVSSAPMRFAVSMTAKGKVELTKASCNGQSLLFDYSSCDVSDWDFQQIGDGKCHITTNTAECNWDGGDCCEETCDHANCGLFWEYNCKNPEINQYAPECNVNFQQLGDGLCHATANNAECGYDDGDCCESTCQGENCGLWGYYCEDPSIICVENANLVGDGKCHIATNTAECNWDGGDCCEATCNHANCGLFWNYDCENPAINQYAPECIVNFQQIGDGLCHDPANNEDCGYDGGDCCEETCVGEKCGLWGYHCNDPSV